MTDFDSHLRQLAHWLTDVSGPEWLWYAKYLSANDTYAKPNVHQGGPHLGRALINEAFPQLVYRAERDANPDLFLPTRIDSHGEHLELRLVWYNSRRLTGQANGRDEARLTRWGRTDSPLVEPDATGSLVLFAFRCRLRCDAEELRIWRCRSPTEEDYLLDRLPEVAPGAGRIVTRGTGMSVSEQLGRCALRDDEIPDAWRSTFPSGEELVDWAAQRSRASGTPDQRLLTRRQYEEQVFYSVERLHALPRIRQGFTSVESFIEFALSVSNRRKARSGRSLELQARMVFREESISFTPTPYTENKKTPDFIFPSIEAYHDTAAPASRLRMLAAKTTCKDRWRQILNEADRIRTKHLLTLQEGVSEGQFREMEAHGVRLVLPAPLRNSYPESIRNRLISIADFVGDLRELAS